MTGIRREVRRKMNDLSERISADDPDLRCWICGGGLRLAKRGNLPDDLRPDAMRITDAHYGVTADIFRCEKCGFLECPNLENVLNLYAEMSDEGYEETRETRARQARTLLKIISGYKKGGRLLDVGAGSGILVEEARLLGFDASGIEPSGPLQKTAVERGLPVKHGVLPHSDITGAFDIVTLFDVIEHVSDPIQLLRELKNAMAPDGICAIATPDLNSIAARLMGWKWWHFRVAHIGYFNASTLNLALESAGLRVKSLTRPTWYFPASYLAERAIGYLPPALRVRVPSIMDRVVVPVNLFDSILVVCEHSSPKQSARALPTSQTDDPSLVPSLNRLV